MNAFPKFLIALTFAGSLLSAPALAKEFTEQLMDEGPGASGGGDLCEDRIQLIRDDLKTWISQGGHLGLKLQNISADDYARAMTAEIEKAKVSCVSAGDANFPVQINGTPKVCIFERKDNGESRITCDTNKFEAMKDSDQYVLVHHEYAGLAGFEPPSGDVSSYNISNQISDFLVSTTVKKLAVRPQSTTLECKVDEREKLHADLESFSVTTSGRQLRFSFTIPAHDRSYGSTDLHDNLRVIFLLSQHVRDDHAYEISYSLNLPADYDTIFCRPFSQDRALGKCQVDYKSLPESQRMMQLRDLTDPTVKPVSFRFMNGYFGVGVRTDESGFQDPLVSYGVSTNFDGLWLQEDSSGPFSVRQENCRITYK